VRGERPQIRITPFAEQVKTIDRLAAFRVVVRTLLFLFIVHLAAAPSITIPNLIA
jgi:hypothetical protein